MKGQRNYQFLHQTNSRPRPGNKWCRHIAFVVLFVSAVVTHAHDVASEATYLGNAGIFVAHGDLQVMFDAFYDQDYGRFVRVDPQTETEMIAGKAPFDSIDAIFVSHVHGDHYATEPIIEHLRNNTDSHLFTSTQVTEALAKALPAGDDLWERVTAFDIRPGDEPKNLIHKQLEIDTIAIPHSGGEQMAQMMNLVFRVKLGQTQRVMHFGDSSDVLADYASSGDFFTTRTDIAFVPFWLYDSASGKQILDTIINAGHAVGFHVPAEAIGSATQWKERLDGDLFVEPGETRKIAIEKD